MGDASPDAGFTLVEGVVAMAVFAVAAAVTLTAVVGTTQAAGSNIRRTAAINLATRQIESLRSMPATAIPDGLQVSTETVGGITYTVRQTAKYVAPDDTTSVCASSGSSLAYKAVGVTVSWANMGNVEPIRVDTLKAVGVGTGELDQVTKGTLALLVSGAAGAPRAGVTVTLTPGDLTQTTGDDGCAVFAGLAVGGYTAAASMDGYAGVANTRDAVSGSLGVTAATISRGTLVYDTDRSLEVRFDAPAEAAVPAGLEMRLGNIYLSDRVYPPCSGPVTAACATGTPGLVHGLFPENYTVTLGSCPASPSTAVVDVRPETVTTPVVTLPAGTLTVDVQNAGGHSFSGRTVTVQAAPASGCTDAYGVSTLGDGGTAVVLPLGEWEVSTPGADPVSVLLSQSQPAQNLVLVVGE